MKTSRFHQSLKFTLGSALLLIGLAAPVNAGTVFQDTFTWGGAGITGDLNANIPARQSGGTDLSTYSDSYINGVGGSWHFLDSASPMTPATDVMYLRTVTAPEVGVNSLSVVGLDTDFATPLAGKHWSGSYDALLTIGVGINDTFLGFGMKTVPDGIVGPGNAAFFFAVRPSGAWLLWRNNATPADFTSGTLSGFDPGFQQYSVSFNVNETAVTPLLSITVTPLGGTPQIIATNVPIVLAGTTRNFGYLSSVVSDGNGGFSDARIDNLTLLDTPPITGIPTLSYAQSGNNFTLSWPVDVTGWVLESSTDLGIADVWDPVPGVVANSVTVPMTGTPKNFFRLKSTP